MTTSQMPGTTTPGTPMTSSGSSGWTAGMEATDIPTNVTTAGTQTVDYSAGSWSYSLLP